MDTIISVLTIVIIIAIALPKTLKKNTKKPNTKAPSSVKKATNSTAVKSNVPAYKDNNVYAKKKSVAPELNHNMLADDRANDWLARQLREEHIAFKKTKDMFDLKIEHASHCDAKYIRDFHHHECNANQVDTAVGR